jgi:hypothetical protein
MAGSGDRTGEASTRAEEGRNSGGGGGWRTGSMETKLASPNAHLMVSTNLERIVDSFLIEKRFLGFSPPLFNKYTVTLVNIINRRVIDRLRNYGRVSMVVP